MATYEDFTNVVLIPLVRDLHQTIVAFLQTSKHGIWQVDEQFESNAFRLHFIRGNWGRSFLGNNRVPKDCDVDHRGGFILRTKPMLLQVALRPSVDEISVRLGHQVFSRLRVKDCEHSDYRKYWEATVTSEVEDLRRYLEGVYGLKKALRIRSLDDT